MSARPARLPAGVSLGERLTFAERIELPGKAGYPRSETVERAGTVWSAGPVPSSVWVIPDDTPRTAVAVKVPTPLKASRGERPRVLPEHSPQRQADTVRRINHVRQWGHAYPTWYAAGWHPDRQLHMIDHWHVDPACPTAAKRCHVVPEHSALKSLTAPVGQIIDVLLRKDGRSGLIRYLGELCPECVMLTESAGTANESR